MGNISAKTQRDVLFPLLSNAVVHAELIVVITVVGMNTVVEDPGLNAFVFSNF